jgi:hypothetical protein
MSASAAEVIVTRLVLALTAAISSAGAGEARQWLWREPQWRDRIRARVRHGRGRVEGRNDADVADAADDGPPMIRGRLLRVAHRKKFIVCAVAAIMIAYASVATRTAGVVGRKASRIRAGMSFSEVSRQLDGWTMINAHPPGRGTQNRAKPGAEYFGYSGEVYVLTPVEPDGRQTDLRKISQTEFEQRMEKLLSDGEPWTVYFNFRIIGPDTGVLLRFDGRGKVVGAL